MALLEIKSRFVSCRPRSHLLYRLNYQKSEERVKTEVIK
jgi:hypothetical protein